MFRKGHAAALRPSGALAVLLAFGLFASLAEAQEAGNEAWIGQTGETNKISIDQEGRGNLAGRDNAALRLNQDGEYNALAIRQYGWANAVGAELRQEGPAGVNQVGDRNSIEVDQHDEDAPGFNAVGGIFQSSPRLNDAAANILVIRQSEAGGADLAAGHAIGSVSQTRTDPARGANSATLRQTGGGVGLGNTIGTLVQAGAGNAMLAEQAEQSNVIDAMRQEGNANAATLEQFGGDGNTIQAFEQYGNANEAMVSQSGSRNVVQHVLQNNAYLAGGGIGNRARIVIKGDDNGGDGLGGTGEFLADDTLELEGVAQANLVQIGDDNDARVTVSQGSLTKYGIAQVGDGNGAIVSIAGAHGGEATGNESAVFQSGLDNNYAQVAIGNANVASAAERGDRNRAALRQEGDGNVTHLSLTGDDNNGVNAGVFGGAAGLAADGSSPLMPGNMTQSGMGNAASVLIDGNDNLAAFVQRGNANMISTVMSGNANAAAVLQAGNADTSIAVQSGMGNSLGVTQY